jgi:RNA polymerase sigma factor (sigma-70 family)
VASEFPTEIYGVLRELAQRQMRGERASHTLGATALVHEAYARFAKQNATNFDVAAFYRQAGDAMRHILIDHARRRSAAKRGGGGGGGGGGGRGGAEGHASHVHGFESVDAVAEHASPEEVVALDRAFLRLVEEDARAGDVVRLRFYAGLTVDETAAALGVSRRSVLRDWDFARAFLARAMQGDDA